MFISGLNFDYFTKQQKTQWVADKLNRPQKEKANFAY